MHVALKHEQYQDKRDCPKSHLDFDDEDTKGDHDFDVQSQILVGAAGHEM